MRGRPHDALGVEGVGDPLPLLRWSMMYCADRGIEVKRGPRTSLLALSRSLVTYVC